MDYYLFFVAEDEGVFFLSFFCFFFCLSNHFGTFSVFRGSVFDFESVFTFKLWQELSIVSPIGCIPAQIVLSLSQIVQCLMLYNICRAKIKLAVQNLGTHGILALTLQ